MPDDLLRFVIGPTPYSWWWLWLAVLLLVVLIAWYVGVFAFTMPEQRIRDLPVLGNARTELRRRRSARAVRGVGDRYRAGELDAAQAAREVSHELRSFLQHVTGVRAEYMHLEAIAASELSSATPVLSELVDAQFNVHSTADVGAASDSAEELIRTWS